MSSCLNEDRREAQRSARSEREGSCEGWEISLGKRRIGMEQQERRDGERAMTLSVNYLEEMKT